LHQTGKNAGHRLVIEAVAAVNNETRQCQRLGEILRRFRLPRARGTRRAPSELECECLGQCHVTSVGERRDHEAAVETHILVAIAEFPGALLDDAVVHITVPIQAKLTLPCKFYDARIILCMIRNNVSMEEVEKRGREWCFDGFVI